MVQGWTGEWIDLFSEAYSYTPEGRLAEALRPNPDGSGSRTRFTYAGGEWIEAQIDYAENLEAGNWQPRSRRSATRDEQARPTEILFQTASAGGFVNSASELLSYDQSVASEEAPAAAGLAVSIAPNPVRTTGTLRFEMARPGDVQLALYDVLGRQVVLAHGPHGAGQHEVALDASRLTPGLYIVRLQADRHAVTRRLTIVR